MWDTLINFWNMGIQMFLIFGDNYPIFFKDMGYFLKKLMGYGILGPPLPGPHHSNQVKVFKIYWTFKGFSPDFSGEVLTDQS